MNKLISIARSYVGTREGSTKHIEIVNKYNGLKPLPQGYKLKTSDNWCAAFVSVCAKEAGLSDFPFECSVRRMWNKATAGKRTAKTGKPGYIIVYDWGHNGSLDHVGIIENTDGKTYTVIEGNFSNAVRRRVISTENIQIYGFIKTGAEDMDDEADLDAVALRVIRGDYGTGDARRIKLAAAGYNYRAVQARVNALYKKRK